MGKVLKQNLLQSARFESKSARSPGHTYAPNYRPNCLKTSEEPMRVSTKDSCQEQRPIGHVECSDLLQEAYVKFKTITLDEMHPK